MLDLTNMESVVADGNHWSELGHNDEMPPMVRGYIKLFNSVGESAEIRQPFIRLGHNSETPTSVPDMIRFNSIDRLAEVW